MERIYITDWKCKTCKEYVYSLNLCTVKLTQDAETGRYTYWESGLCDDCYSDLTKEDDSE